MSTKIERRDPVGVVGGLAADGMLGHAAATIDSVLALRDSGAAEGPLESLAFHVLFLIGALKEDGAQSRMGVPLRGEPEFDWIRNIDDPPFKILEETREAIDRIRAGPDEPGTDDAPDSSTP